MLRHSASEQEIRNWVLRQHGLTVEPGWIAHCKELCGLSAAAATTIRPCPPEIQPAIKQAFRHFGLLS